MYYPVQIPYILNKEFSEAVRYSEEVQSHLSDFLICFWEMQPKSTEAKKVENIIIADGCIDLIVDFDNRQIGFAGMSSTNFEFKINSACHFFGARMKPGAFYALTGIPAADTMDDFIPINVYDINFDTEGFFNLPFDKAKTVVKNYLGNLIAGKSANGFVRLFDELSGNIPKTVAEVYKHISFSPRQCQRLFKEHFGLTPQMVLCILRFQKCLEILTSGKASPSDVLSMANYYDQAHFIKNFKRNIGLTPFELVRKYA